MHAIGNITDGIFPVGYIRPDIVLHLRGYRPVDTTDPVMKARATQGQGRLIEGTVITRCGAQLQERLHIDTQVLDIVEEVTGNQFMVEDVVSRGDRCVRGKDRTTRDHLQCCCKFKPLQGALATAFQDLKGRVTFIDMPDGGFDPQCSQCTHTTDTEHNFLLDAGALVTTVELVGNNAVVFLVPVQITVQQVQGNVPGLGTPNMQVNLAARKIDLDQYRLAILVNGLGDGQIMKG